jgi:putative membrane protein
MKLSKPLSLLAALVLSTAFFAVGGASAADKPGQVSGLDEVWLVMAMQSDLFEVKSGETAMTRSANPAVKEIGDHLIKDHAKSLQEGAKLAKQLGIKVPKAPTFPQKWELLQISALSGDAFDAAFLSLQAGAHKQSIVDAKEELALGSSPLVRREAREALPILRMHLAMVKKAQVGG